MLQHYFKRFEELDAEGMAQLNGMERDFDLMQPTAIKIRTQRLEQLDHEWKETAEEFIQRVQGLGL